MPRVVDADPQIIDPIMAGHVEQAAADFRERYEGFLLSNLNQLGETVSRMAEEGDWAVVGAQHTRSRDIVSSASVVYRSPREGQPLVVVSQKSPVLFDRRIEAAVATQEPDELAAAMRLIGYDGPPYEKLPKTVFRVATYHEAVGLSPLSEAGQAGRLRGAVAEFRYSAKKGRASSRINPGALPGAMTLKVDHTVPTLDIASARLRLDKAAALKK